MISFFRCLARLSLLCCVVLPYVSCKDSDDYIDIALDDELLLLLENSSNGEGVSFFTLPDETDLASIPQDPLNPLTPSKVALGQLLVHETATGGDPKAEGGGTIYMYACASCHPVASGFYAGILQGIGEGGSGFGVAGEGRVIMPENIIPRDSLDVLPIKVPTIINSAYQEVMLWNGALGGTGINEPYVAQNAADFPDNLLGLQGLEVQGMAGQTAHRLLINDEFAETFGYKDLFDEAFPNVPVDERYSRRTGGLAIAAFNRTVLANQSPWQQYLRGDPSAMTDDQKEGAKIFFDKGRCYECHTGPALKSNEFHAFGMNEFDPDEAIILEGRRSFKREVALGRASFTGLPEDNYKFKVPTIYNLKDNAFYGHGGSFRTLRELVEYKVRGIKQNPAVPDAQLAEQFVDLDLTETEISNLVEFLKDALYDPNLTRYVPETVPSGNCIPNNDSQSRIDLGCD